MQRTASLLAKIRATRAAPFFFCPFNQLYYCFVALSLLTQGEGDAKIRTLNNSETLRTKVALATRRI